MFPSDLNFADIKISTTDANSDEPLSVQTLGRSPYFDFEKKEFVISDGINRECDLIESVKQHTRLFINTLKNKYAIYDDVFGVDTDGVVGYRLPRSVAIATIKQQITEDLIRTCPVIAEITDWDFDGKTGTFYFTEILRTGESVVITDDL